MISLNSLLFSKVPDVGQLCVNPFDRLEYIAVVKLYDLDSQIQSGYLVDYGCMDLTIWFLIPKELEVVIKYDGVIQAVQFNCSLYGDLFADYKSGCVGDFYMCCD